MKFKEKPNFLLKSITKSNPLGLSKSRIQSRISLLLLLSESISFFLKMTELNRIYEKFQKINSQIKHDILFSGEGPNEFDRGYESGFGRALYELKTMLNEEEKVFSMKMGESLVKN